MYHDAIERDYREHAELVAVCDTNPGHLQLACRRSESNGAKAPAIYLSTDFERMIAETKPHRVIVTTPDTLHDDYVVRAMESGCDVISEKPLATTA